MKRSKFVRLMLLIIVCSGLFACSDFGVAITVNMLNPPNDAQNVTVIPTIELEFSEPVNGVDVSTISLHKDSEDGRAVPLGAITPGADNRYTFSPSQVLSTSSDYYVIVSSEITSIDNNRHVGRTVFSFTTAASGQS